MSRFDLGSVGDAMVAGVLHGILAHSCARGLRYGSVCVALSLRSYGDQLIVDGRESERLVDAPTGMIER